ncbi:copia protein [Trichonephila clavata]|uniref:Copia protein n=1 Tax=Trichonephila clavata TaxID=2740835 RepID=A0A8X6FKP8_TRICU|nr:copia protein [Trichonephila clavata]
MTVAVGGVTCEFKGTGTVSMLFQNEVNDLRAWHSRMCHINKRYIIQTSKNTAVKVLPKLEYADLKCEPCKIAKSRRKSFKPIGKVRSSKTLELLHMDLCGLLPDVSIVKRFLVRQEKKYTFQTGEL